MFEKMQDSVGSSYRIPHDEINRAIGRMTYGDVKMFEVTNWYGLDSKMLELTMNALGKLEWRIITV